MLASGRERGDGSRQEESLRGGRTAEIGAVRVPSEVRHSEKRAKDEVPKQVDDMFFYGYRCCMKKHGITQDTPSYPSDDEDEVAGNLTRGEGNASTVNPSCERA